MDKLQKKRQLTEQRMTLVFQWFRCRLHYI